MGTTNYDGAGNQIQFGANTLVYDAENHVVQANEAPSSGGRQTQYVYDGDGRRVMKMTESRTESRESRGRSTQSPNFGQ